MATGTSNVETDLTMDTMQISTADNTSKTFIGTQPQHAVHKSDSVPSATVKNDFYVGISLYTCPASEFYCSCLYGRDDV